MGLHAWSKTAVKTWQSINCCCRPTNWNYQRVVFWNGCSGGRNCLNNNNWIVWMINQFGWDFYHLYISSRSSSSCLNWIQFFPNVSVTQRTRTCQPEIDSIKCPWSATMPWTLYIVFVKTLCCSGQPEICIFKDFGRGSDHSQSIFYVGVNIVHSNIYH